MSKLLILQNLWHELLGVEYISSILKSRGHQCEVSIGENNFLKDIKEINPDLIGFSIMSTHWEFVKKVASELKSFGIKTPIIVGGSHPTFFNEAIYDENIDMICIGEGEYSILELMERIQKKEGYDDIPNIWYKENGKIIKNKISPLIENLDSLPFPDRAFYRRFKLFKYFPYVFFMAIRGCPYECNFCFNKVLKNLSGKASSNYVRFRSVDNAIAELKYIKNTLHPKLILFLDGTFVLKEDWLIEFCERYQKKVGIPFECTIRVDRVSENEIAALKKANCYMVRFAFECGSLRIRKELLNKNFTDKRVLEVSQLLRKYQIKIHTCSMMGLPTESFQEACRTIELNQKIKPHYLSFYLFHPFKKLKLTDFALEKGIINRGNLEKITTKSYNIHSSLLHQRDIEKVTNLLKFACWSIRLPCLFNFFKKISSLPRNFVFDFLFDLSLSWEQYRALKWNPYRFIKFVFKNYRQFS